LRGIYAEQAQLKAESTGGFGDILNASLQKLANTGKTTTTQLTNSFSTFFGSIEDGFAKAVGQSIVYGKSVSQALGSVAKEAAADLISSLVKIGEQWLLNAVLGDTAMATSATTSVATAATMSAAWVPVATAVSIATMGAADAAAITGMTAAYASGIALSSVSSAGGAAHFADGGPIGGQGGPRDDKVPLWASPGEYIVNASATSSNRQLLDYINSGKSLDGRHFANGGMVGANSNYPGAANGNMGGQTNHFDFSGANFGGADPDQIQARFEKVMKEQYEPRITQNAAGYAVAAVNKQNKRSVLNKR